MKKLLTIGYYVLIAGILLVSLLFISTLFKIPGNFSAKIVLSGSMEPAIMTGSLVVIKPLSDYNVGDIITFGGKTSVPTTHRIVKVRVESGEKVFTTKGDANGSQDSKEISQKDVIGKVLFSIPYMGYVFDFAKRPVGLVIFVIIPAGIVAIEELFKIYREIKKTVLKKKKEKEEGKTEDKKDEE